MRMTFWSWKYTPILIERRRPDGLRLPQPIRARTEPSKWREFRTA